MLRDNSRLMRRRGKRARTASVMTVPSLKSVLSHKAPNVLQARSRWLIAGGVSVICCWVFGSRCFVVENDGYE
jgi:uncharacterized membrane protein